MIILGLLDQACGVSYEACWAKGLCMLLSVVGT